MAASESKAEAPQGLVEKSWHDVPLTDINLEDTTFQLRVSARLDGLRTSLAALGQLEPVDLTGKKPYRVVNGFQRILAARALGWPSVKAFLHELTDDSALQLAFAENVARKNLSPIESAQAIVLAQKQGAKPTELGKLLGITPRHVDRLRKLLELPAPIQKILDGKVVTAAHARLLAEFGVKDPENWRKRIEAERLDVRALRRLLSAELGKKGPGKKKRYLQRDKAKVRFYPFVLTAKSPADEREKVTSLLKDTLALLEKWASASAKQESGREDAAARG